jgi:hypothetical protein
MAVRKGVKFFKFDHGTTDTEIQITPPSWIDVRSMLPLMFQNVIVWGVRSKLNVCHQAWEARRWTGCTSGFDVEKDKLWSWEITGGGGSIHKVTHWFPMPEVIMVPDERWSQRMEWARKKQELEKYGELLYKD